ncbi:MAG: hypothetical protein NXI30_04340 [bacterium]|nr:hypothetical protein [bacterium]
MGTNYYWRPKSEEPCETCGHVEFQDDLHIGKSSGGWCFSLHVIPEEEIHNLDDWRERWALEGSTIVNEYGTIVAPEEMDVIVTERSWGGKPPHRHMIDNHCIAHGEGTWDLCVGEFF